MRLKQDWDKLKQDWTGRKGLKQDWESTETGLKMTKPGLKQDWNYVQCMFSYSWSIVIWPIKVDEKYQINVRERSIPASHTMLFSCKRAVKLCGLIQWIIWKHVLGTQTFAARWWASPKIRSSKTLLNNKFFYFRFSVLYLFTLA